MGSTIRPYRINVPDAALKTLQNKLELTTYPGETTFTNDWRYGASLQDIKRLVDHWKTEFHWRSAEAKLNQIPQFTTTIPVDGHEDDLKIHFVHQKAEKPDSIPLLFVHGWASSFIEVTKILPHLTQTNNDNTPSFHVVAPSLPNCGFSQRTSKPGFGILQHAEVCHKLMLQLGYKKYGVFLQTSLDCKQSLTAAKLLRAGIGGSSLLVRWGYSTRTTSWHRTSALS
jgi:hypothetical protein